MSADTGTLNYRCAKFHNCEACGFLENAPKFYKNNIAEAGLKKAVGLYFPVYEYYRISQET
jgi:hypothetical protein